MKKIIRIDGKDYTMQSSAYTQFAYKNETGRSLLKDLQKLIDLKNVRENKFEMEDLDNVTELLLKIAFVMIKEAGESQIVDYTSFLKSIGSIYDDEKWIIDTLELACTPISGRLQTTNK